MAQRIRILTIGVIAFLLWGTIATATTIYYYQQYFTAQANYAETYQKYLMSQANYTDIYQKYVAAQGNYTALRGLVIKVSVKINYGNGTSTTNGSVYLPVSATVFNATKTAEKIDATYYPAFQAYLVDAINGVANNANGNNKWWEYWVNGALGLVSADHYQLHDGDSVEWKYQ